MDLQEIFGGDSKAGWPNALQMLMEIGLISYPSRESLGQQKIRRLKQSLSADLD
jgi:hypothetical protein